MGCWKVTKLGFHVSSMNGKALCKGEVLGYCVGLLTESLTPVCGWGWTLCKHTFLSPHLVPGMEVLERMPFGQVPPTAPIWPGL